MHESKPHPDLQLEEHLTFQRRLMLVQRVGWGVLLVGLAAAVAGLFGGGGPWSTTSASAGPVQVDYPRFARYGAALHIEVEVATAAGAAQPVVLTLAGGYGDELQLESVLPHPERMSSSERGVVLEFAPAPGSSQVIRIAGKTDQLGPLAGEIRVDGQPPVRLHSFVYP